MQLTLDQYAAWVEQEQKWRLTPEELVLLKHSYSYTRKDRAKEMTDEMKYLRNTKARQYRRVRTFEAYLNELERCKAKRPQEKINIGSSRKQSLTDVESKMVTRLGGCYNRAKQNGYGFDLDLDFLMTLANETPNCPCCDVPLVYSGESSNASLDKVVPSLGYVKTNVNFLCSTCNRLKSDHSVETLQRVLNYMMG